MPDFRKEFERVRTQVVMGNAHLELWKNLYKRLSDDPQRLATNAAPTFFGMTLEAHLNTAILHAARIFDTQRNSLNIQKTLKQADTHSRGLSGANQKSLQDSLRDARVKLPALESSLKAVRTRRSKTLAHLDPMVISHPDEVAKNSEITVDELQKIFAVASEILNGISAPYWDLSFSPGLIGVDDYETVLDLVENGKKRQREEYEAEFGPFPEPSS